MGQEKFDIVKNASEIAAKAEKNSKIQIRRPGQKAYEYFMGGANGGEVLTQKSQVLQNPEKTIKQVTFEYHADLDDYGDLGTLKNIISELGFSIIPVPHEKPTPPDEEEINEFNKLLGGTGFTTIPNPNPLIRRGLGTMPHWRTFSLTDSGLYADCSVGALSRIVEMGAKETVRITSEKQLAQTLFDAIASLEENSKGRDLFALFTDFFLKDPPAFTYALMDHYYGNLDFDEPELLASTRKSMKEDKYEKQYSLHNIAWMYHYRGQVPAKWNMWQYVMEDVEKAGKAGQSLPEDLLEAALLHPIHHVIRALYENIKLSANQLAIVFVQIGNVDWMNKEISRAQKAKGVTEEEIALARQIAKEKGRELLAPVLNQPIPPLE